MTKTVARALTFAAWLATAILVVASIIGYLKLTTEVEKLKAERAQLNARYSDVRADRNILTSHTILLKNSLIAYNGYTDKTRRILDGNCAPAWAERCRRYLRYSELLDYHSGTLLTRIGAKTPTDYQKLLERYRTTVPLIEAVNWRTSGDEKRHWSAIAEEGQAYALWKLGHPKAARSLIDAALGKHGGSPIIVSTHLKVRCALHEDRGSIRREYVDYREATKTRIAHLASDQAADRMNSSQFNLDLFSADQELATICGYALSGA